MLKGRALFSLFLFFLILTSFSSFKKRTGGEPVQYYSCVRYEHNSFVGNTDKNLYSFYYQIDRYLKRRSGKLNIVHIGDSHIQADLMTEETRVLLQKTFGNGGRGFVFPFPLAGTNNPLNYKVDFGGNWSDCKGLQNNPLCDLGLLGITVSSRDSDAYFNLNPNTGALKYDFDRVKLFYKNSPGSFGLRFKSANNQDFYADEQPITNKYSQIFYSKTQDSFQLRLKREFAGQNEFTFYGMSFENNNPGLVYHSIGINGAFVKTYLKGGDLFAEQLKALEPDLIIISLGTNDGYLLPPGKVCKSCFRDQYRQLIKRVTEASPGTSILLTTPGDSYIRRAYHNISNKDIRDVIFGISEEFATGLWDFNAVMGGDYSIKSWASEGLAKNDLIHFTKEGYRLQGRLLYEAILGGYEKRFDD